MKKSNDVLVLFSFNRHKGGFNELLFTRLHAAAKQRSLQLYRGALADAQMTVIHNTLAVTESLTGRDVASFGLLYFELWYKSSEMALAAALYAKRHHVAFFSEELARLSAVTKVGELAVLSDNDLPLPNTFISSSTQIKKRFQIDPPLGYPLVVKAADGYGGNNNFLVRDYGALQKVLDDNKGIRFVVQEFIPNDCDYRCLVLGGKVGLVLQRTRNADADTHLNNTSQGGAGAVVPVTNLSAAVRADVVKAARLLGRDEFAGVDLMFDSETGQHYILEVNQMPQIETGAETDQKMDALLTYMQSRLTDEGDDND